MSNVMRWRHGETHPVLAAVNENVSVEIGDLLYQEVDDARPAAAQSDAGTEHANQAAFHAKFLGVAMQQSLSGETKPIRVASRGVFEFPCTSATFELGDLVGVVEQESGTALESQKVMKVSQPGRAIGRVVRREPSAASSVLVAIESTILFGGPQPYSTASSGSG